MLGDLAALGPFFAVSSHLPGGVAGSPWRPVSELTSASQVLSGRIASVRAALARRAGPAVGHVEPRVAASAVHLGLAARLTAPALGAAVLGCPLDPRPGGLWWQDAPGGPVPLSVPLPAPVPGPAAAGEGGERAPGTQPGLLAEALLAEAWDRVLVDELLAPLTAAVADLVPVSGRVLRGNVASAVNAAAAQVARQRPDLAAGAWQAAARLFGSPWLSGERNPPGPAFRRSSCCLFYRLAPGNKSAVCGDCVLAG